MTPGSVIPAARHHGATSAVPRRRSRSAREAMLAAPLLALCFVAAYDAVLCAAAHDRLARAAAVLAATLAASDWPASADLSAALEQARRLAAPSRILRDGITVSVVRAGPGRGVTTLWRQQLGPSSEPSSRADPAPDIATVPVVPDDGRRYAAAAVVAPADPWLVGAPLLQAWFGDLCRVSSSAPMREAVAQ